MFLLAVEVAVDTKYVTLCLRLLNLTMWCLVFSVYMYVSVCKQHPSLDPLLHPPAPSLSVCPTHETSRKSK